MKEMSKQSKQDTNDLFPIRTVCSITGVNPVTLRAWERRYGLIKPTRTPKGHRLYSQADVDRINEARRLLDKGIPISQVRQSIDYREERRSAISDAANHWSQYVANMVNAIGLFDEIRLDKIYNEALSLYPADTVLRYLIIPLLQELGRRWETNEGSVAEEHFFGVFLRNKLGARFHHLRAVQHGPKLLAACLPHEYHETGLLLFSLMAKSSGYDIVLLGANMPLDQLPLAARRAKCDAILLTGSQAYDYTQIAQELSAMMQKVEVPVFVGGNFSVTARDIIAHARAIPLGEDMPQALKLIQQTLDAGRP